MTCAHHRRSYDCVDCYRQGTGGRGICVHERRRNRCTQCRAAGGSPRELCGHAKQHHQCSECLGTSTLTKTAFCSACGVKRLSKRRRVSGGLCAGCAGVQPRKEKIMMDAILENVDHEPSGLDDLTFGGVTCSTRQRRPDGI